MLLAVCWGCHKIQAPASAVKMSDPAAANQLTYGFYQVEMNAWRWSGRNFSVALKPPPDAEQHGAKLLLRLYIPESHIEQLGAITLSADVAGYPLCPRTFSESGSYTYARDVPANALESNIIPVNFSLDKTAPPSPSEGRELGAVVTGVELQSK